MKWPQWLMQGQRPSKLDFEWEVQLVGTKNMQETFSIISEFYLSFIWLSRQAYFTMIWGRVGWALFNGMFVPLCSSVFHGINFNTYWLLSWLWLMMNCKFLLWRLRWGRSFSVDCGDRENIKIKLSFVLILKYLYYILEKIYIKHICRFSVFFLNKTN